MGNISNVSYVDKEWYLNTYPDVAAAGLDPVVHFERHGKFEGRLPCLLSSLPLERDLWAHAFTPNDYIEPLKKLSKGTGLDSAYARKSLAAFYLFQKQYSLALKYGLSLIRDIETLSLLVDESVVYLIVFEAAFRSGNKELARQMLDNKSWVGSNSKLLARQMLAGVSGNLDFLNKIYSKNGLMKVKCENSIDKLNHLKGCPGWFKPSSAFNWLRRSRSTSKVSIIVPLYNAANSIQTTLNSLLAQTWSSIEIIVVNDCSTDNSLEVLERYAQEPKISVVTNSENIGAYPTRNRGVKLATGDYVTVMDADDWAHPQKIESQVIPLIRKNSYMGSLSHWVRCNSELEFTRLRADNSWVYRNVSSLMVRRAVFDTVGYWDELKASADTEFYLRLIANYGDASLLEVYPDVPLSFGRVHEASLTQSTTTHLVTQFGGPRQEHLAFARIWHTYAPKPLRFDPRQQTFPVPIEICPQPQSRNSSIEELERWRRAIDNSWYLNAYPNVDKMGQSVYEHFWQFGEADGLSPSPLFVPGAYRYKENISSGQSPTWEALRTGWQFTNPIKVEGRSFNNGEAITLFAHSVSEFIFGAEKSFVDMVKACNAGGYRVFVFLPNASNGGYIDTLLEYSEAIYFIPLQWFKKSRKEEAKITDFLRSFFTENEISLVYLNTIMLHEPYIAARKASIKTLTHVRELPEYDEHIQNLLNESANETRERLTKLSDYFVANSYLTSEWLNSLETTQVIYNKVEASGELTELDASQPLRVCMLSSNIPKKGVLDFFEVAHMCKGSPIEFNLYGPITEEVKKMAREKGGEVNLRGYATDAGHAIRKNDIVLCLSWFKESFGRTAAEAMLNGRVVVGYEWGAICEFVNETTGVLVPFRRPELIAEQLRIFAADKRTLISMAHNAQCRAEHMFSVFVYNSNLNRFINQILTRE